MYRTQSKKPVTRFRFSRRTDSKRIEKYGQKFDSQTELLFYEALLTAGIPFRFKVEYEVIPKIKANKAYPLLQKGSNSRIMIVDFVLDFEDVKMIVDTKGEKDYVTELSKFKYNLLKYKLSLTEEKQTTQIKFVYYKDVVRIHKLAAYKQPIEQIIRSLKPL